MELFKGFNRWQVRIAGFGAFGVIAALVGLFGPWLPMITVGIVITLSCIIALSLLGNRQNWRQLRALQREISQRTALSTKLKTSSQESTTDRPIPLGADYEYARRVESNRPSLESFALRSKSLKIRDAFALAATSNQFKYTDLVRLISVQRMKMLPNIKQHHVKHWNENALLSLARIQANQRISESDLINSSQMFAFIQSFFGMKALKRNDRLIYLEVLGDLERFDQQAALTRRFNIAQQYPIQEKLLELNSVRHESGSTSPAWLNLLNALYSRHGFSSVEMKSSIDEQPLDRLQTRVSPIAAGPRVSVIVPTFQGGPLLLSALSSLLNQSWQNLEIIVVDDGSGSEYEQFLSQAEALSDRITVLRQQQNLGAYCARNSGLSVATGEYITVHDDDDWSHGDKIALQVRHLIDNPEVPGSMTRHVRVTEELKFTRINNNPVLSQANFSSLMVHRSVFDKVGAWDTVNRGADSEFRDRLVKYFGTPVDVLQEVPLSFTRTWEGSLTSGEMSRGFVDPSRLLYLDAYTQAHEAARAPQDLYHSRDRRRFPVPSSMEPGSRDKDMGTFDVVFMTDFRFPGGTSSLTLREIETASLSGLRVGYIQADSPLNRPQNPISSHLLKLQLKGTVTQLSLQDRADVSLLIIRHPSVVNFMDSISSRLRVVRSVLIVNNPPVLVGGDGMVFDLPSCVANIEKLFQHRACVIAESAVTKALCEGLVPASRLAPMSWPGLVPLGQPHEPDFSRKPVLGRHSRDHDLKWPSDKNEFEKAYISEEFSTMILGGADALVRKHGSEVIESLTVHDFGEVDVPQFLSRVDFWAYFHDDRLVESFGMSIAEAMADGKVVILPEYLRSSFGYGALYAKPAEVESIIREYWSNPSKYYEQSRRAQDYVQEHFSVEAFLTRLEKLSDKT